MSQLELLDGISEASTLDEVQEYINTVIEMRGFAEESLLEMMLLLLEETGELAKAVRKTATKMSMDPDKQQNYGTVESEAADVFIVLLSICNKLGINLLTALKNKEAENCKRNWTFER